MEFIFLQNFSLIFLSIQKQQRPIGPVECTIHLEHCGAGVPIMFRYLLSRHGELDIRAIRTHFSVFYCTMAIDLMHIGVPIPIHNCTVTFARYKNFHLMTFSNNFKKKILLAKLNFFNFVAKRNCGSWY